MFPWTLEAVITPNMSTSILLFNVIQRIGRRATLIWKQLNHSLQLQHACFAKKISNYSRPLKIKNLDTET
jgi:hypothetical protein